MTALLNDGHINFMKTMPYDWKCYPYFIADFAEEQLVVSRLLSDDTELIEGDIILEIDGVQTNRFVIEERKTGFGSN